MCKCVAHWMGVSQQQLALTIHTLGRDRLMLSHLNEILACNYVASIGAMSSGSTAEYMQSHADADQ
jgi:hypothetical protein